MVRYTTRPPHNSYRILGSEFQITKLEYHKEKAINSLYIDLSENSSSESCEISEGVIIGYNEKRKINR